VWVRVTFIAVAAGGNFQLTFPYGDALAIFQYPLRPSLCCFFVAIGVMVVIAVVVTVVRVEAIEPGRGRRRGAGVWTANGATARVSPSSLLLAQRLSPLLLVKSL
jgi:hypothetical protein